MQLQFSEAIFSAHHPNIRPPKIASGNCSFLSEIIFLREAKPPSGNENENPVEVEPRQGFQVKH